MLPSLHIFLRCDLVQRNLFGAINLLIVSFEKNSPLLSCITAFLQRLCTYKFPPPSSILFSCLFISNTFQCNCIRRQVIIVDCCHFPQVICSLSTAKHNLTVQFPSNGLYSKAHFEDLMKHSRV